MSDPNTQTSEVEDTTVETDIDSGPDPVSTHATSDSRKRAIEALKAKHGTTQAHAQTVKPVTSKETEEEAAELSTQEATSEADQAKKPDEKPLEIELAGDIALKKLKAEKRLQEERQAFKAEREAFEKEAKPALERLKDIRSGIRKDAASVLKSLDASLTDDDLITIATDIWASQMGDAAPADWKESRAKKAVEADLIEWKARAEQAEQALKAREEAEQAKTQEESQKRQLELYRQEISNHVGQLAKSDKHPNLARIAQAKPDTVLNRLLKNASEYAAITGKIPSLEDLSNAWEVELRDTFESIGTPKPNTRPASEAKKPVHKTKIASLSERTSSKPLSDKEAKRLRAQEILKERTRA